MRARALSIFDTIHLVKNVGCDGLPDLEPPAENDLAVLD
jgi:hypothetical protein